MNSYKFKGKIIKIESCNTKEEVKEKLKKEKNDEYSEKPLLLIKTATELDNVIEEYDLRNQKNKHIRIISLLDPIYYINSINILQV